MIPIKSSAEQYRLATKIAFWIIPIIICYSIIFRFALTFSNNELFQNINEAVSEGTVSNKVFWLIILGLTLFSWSVIRKEPSASFVLNTQSYLLFAYIAYSLISILWSDVTFISLRRSFQQVIIVACMMMPFLLGLDHKEILRKVSWIFAVFVLLNVALIPVFGIADFGYRGICPQKNILGQISAVAFFFCTYSTFTGALHIRRLFSLCSILSIFLIVISNSKTSLGLILVVPILSYFLVLIGNTKDGLKKVFFGSLLVISSGLISATFLLIPLSIYDVSEVIFNDRTFTGRTFIWDFASYYINKEPFFGYGFGSFWGVGVDTKAIGQGFIGGLLQAHNGYIDIVLDLGYLGLALATLYIVSLFGSVFSSSRDDQGLAILLLSCLLFVLLNNTMESSLFRGYTPLWVFFLFCSGITSRRKS